MKIYIAAKFEKKSEVLALYEKFKSEGHEIAYDWTTHKPIKPYENNQEIAKEYSDNELKAIENCEVFIYIADEKEMILPMELGAALMLNKATGKPQIYAVGGNNDKSQWFFNKGVIRVDSAEQIKLK